MRNMDVIMDERDKFVRAATDGLSLRVGLKVENPVPGAEELRATSLVDLARECLYRAGLPSSGSKEEVAKRALTSSDFPNVLANVANKSLLEGYGKAQETWPLWCGEGSASDFREQYIYKPGDDADLGEVPEGGFFPEEGFGVEREDYRISTFGKIFRITRQAIINDELNVLTKIPQAYGEAAARTIGDLAYGLLSANPTMEDGTALFHADHGNLAASGATPSYDTIKAGIVSMMQQKDAAGKRSLHIRPQFLLLPVTLYIDVQELLDLVYITQTEGG